MQFCLIYPKIVIYSMSQWAWKSYVKDPKGKTLVQEWCEEVDKFVWTEFKTSIKFLDGQPPANWKRPFVSVLTGGKRGRKTGCVGLVEIRFEVKNVQYRPLGYFSDELEFTFLLFAKEVGSEFEPLLACKIAKTRIEEITVDKEKVREFWFEKRDSKKHH